MKKAIPNPGSDEALAQGCTCPVLDNNHGAGEPGFLGIPLGGTSFWMTDGCPVHSSIKETKQCKSSTKKSKQRARSSKPEK